MNARPLMRLRLTTAPTEEIGPTPRGMLSIFPITVGLLKASACAESSSAVPTG